MGRSAYRRGIYGRQAPPPRVPRAPGTEYVARFNYPLNGDGTICLLDYTAASSEFARIEFHCLVPGRLRVVVAGREVLAARTGAGRAFLSGIFIPAGAGVLVTFTNVWAGGAVSGEVRIGPAPIEDKLRAARAAFGLREKFTADELSKAHKKMVSRWHPDRPGGNTAKMAEYNAAFEVLKASLAE